MAADRRQSTVMGNEKIYSSLSLRLIMWESSAGGKRDAHNNFLEDFHILSTFQVDKKVEGKY
jgi:hypothetical protein